MRTTKPLTTLAPLRYLKPRHHLRPISRCLSTTTPSNFDIAAIHKAMTSRPFKITTDTLSPTNSHLLNICLSDFLPEECQPRHFAPSSYPPPTQATPLPPGHHLVYFPLQLPASALLPDGTDPAHAPGGPFTRRMWAGGEVSFRASDEPHSGLVLDGRRGWCLELIEDVQLKGDKVFVSVRRCYGAGPEPVAGRGDEAGMEVAERRTLVFMREAEVRGTEKGRRRVLEAPYKADYSVKLTPSARLLFQYSALTFNAHSIHLDPQYCREIEGHRGLLVHGPLSLTLMLSVLRSQLGQREEVANIEYRNLAPLYAGEAMRVCIRQRPSEVAEAGADKKWDVWVEGPDGGLAVKATAITRSTEPIKDKQAKDSLG